MSKNKMLIGIDPDVDKSGIAFINGTTLTLENLTFFELFGGPSKLGAVVDYKVLVGNTSLSSLNSTRVNSNILVFRPVNYRNSSLTDLGPFSTRFARRDLAAQRKIFGAVRSR